jgi:hypothetical protein
LADLLLENEPRYMRQVNFPQAFVGDLAQLLVEAKEEAEMDLDLDDPDDLFAEADRIKTLGAALEVLSAILPGAVTANIEEVLSLLSSQEDHLNERYREALPREEEPYDEVSCGDRLRSPSI